MSDFAALVPINAVLFPLFTEILGSTTVFLQLISKKKKINNFTAFTVFKSNKHSLTNHKTSPEMHNTLTDFLNASV